MAAITGAVIFDWDGTITDIVPGVISALQSVANALHIPYTVAADELRELFTKIGWPAAVSKIFGPGWDAPAMQEKLNALYEEYSNAQPPSPVFGDIIPSIMRLIEKGIRIAIISKAEPVRLAAELKASGIEHLFGTGTGTGVGTSAVAAVDGGKGPHIRAMIEKNPDWKRGEYGIYYIGDLPSDVEAVHLAYPTEAVVTSISVTRSLKTVEKMMQLGFCFPTIAAATDAILSKKLLFCPPSMARIIAEAMHAFCESKGIAPADFYVLAGAAMSLHGLRPGKPIRDIDAFVPGLPTTHEKMTVEGIEIDAYNEHKASADKARQFYFDHEKRMLSGEYVDIEGVKCMTIPMILELKLELNREKDQADIALLRSILRMRFPECKSTQPGSGAPLSKEAEEKMRKATLSLREVTKETFKSIVRLSVRPDQERFVASNAYSVAQAHFDPEAWFRAIYAGEEPVGFVMMRIAPAREEYFIWRFMIDQRYQKFGFGRVAIGMVIEYIRKTCPQSKAITVSYEMGEGGPEGFYRKLGFVPTGEMLGTAPWQEAVARLKL